MKARNILFISISVLLLFYLYGSTRVHSQYVDEVKKPDNEKTPVQIERKEETSKPPERTKEEFAEYPTITRRLPLPSDTEISNFLKWHAQLHEDQDMQRNRHIVYEGHPVWGFGNRYMGLLTAITFGVATSRAIIISDYMMDSVIKWPFDASIGTHDFSTYSKAAYHLENDACYRENYDISIGRNLSTLNLDDMYPEQIVTFHSNCPAFHWIARNPRYTEHFTTLGLLPKDTPEIEYNVHIAASLSYIFFGTVKPSIQSQLDAVLQDWIANRYFVIGMQVRSAFTDINAFTDFENCARKLSENRHNVRYFIASDRSDIREKAFLAFGTSVLDLTKYNLDDGLGNAVIDSFLLGECDEIIVTPYSSFGVIGALRRGKVPLEPSCTLANIEKGPSPANEDYVLW